jgi:hypothetical protein
LNPSIAPVFNRKMTVSLEHRRSFLVSVVDCRFGAHLQLKYP